MKIPEVEGSEVLKIRLIEKLIRSCSCRAGSTERQRNEIPTVEEWYNQTQPPIADETVFQPFQITMVTSCDV